ncbi:hypothetical protein B2K_38585 [Paenibacillus mucilaginosus K02]|uniref:Uncharacterized protein n=1 Tax=Paenibacillus mucilaginosus K02 TaxID=997761 RepID=R9UL67_9BACL|nr:hypothetical protein B2K_38585 [Paenibacillus mucilaginosus K02]
MCGNGGVIFEIEERRFAISGDDPVFDRTEADKASEFRYLLGNAGK